jgi:sucrose-6-phosphate hydrolase SacC (GH32 family)
MHRTEPEPAGRGRLHGRMLQLLGALSGVVALVAMWQLGVFGGGADREPVSAVDGATTEWPTSATESSSAAAAAEASSSALESPSESASATASPTPSDAATTGAPPSDDDEETGEEEEEAPVEGVACVAYLYLDEEWQDSVDVDVEVVNTGDERLGYWEIDLDLRDAEVYHHWNMVDVGHDWFGAEDWNAVLDPGEDAVTGFQAEVEDDFDLPSSVPCTAAE